MESNVFSDPALTLGLALAVGMLAQAAARHLRLPGIVLLLGAGVVLGPDLLGVVQPDSLGPALQVLVAFAVAVILFEGGLNLDFDRLRREARSIQRLVTLGALVTWAGGALAARLLLEWDWTRAVLFGSLVIVTGPTVINPLLRRLKVRHNVATVLEAEGVLVDAIGAIVAVVALEVVLAPGGDSLAHGAFDLLLRLGLGAAIGAAAGLLIAFLLRFEGVVPEGLENVFTLSLVLAVFQVSNAAIHESGIVAVTAAGMVVGNFRSRALSDLKEFKEQLTVLFIGMLFVLLAADVRLAEVRGLGWGGVATVAALMLVVRPLNVLVSTAGTRLETRERAFLAWLAPRGIVAAAVSSLFAQTLEQAGIAGGSELRALVFLVIAATVLIQGLSGGPVARLLGLRRASDAGYVILGADRLALAIGQLLRQDGREVLFLESNADHSREAEEAGFRVIFGNGLTERLLTRAELDGRTGCLALTPNDGLNLAFARRARGEFKAARAWVALRRGHLSVTPSMVTEAGARILFAEPRNLEQWAVRLENGTARIERWLPSEASTEPPGGEQQTTGPEALTSSAEIYLPLAVERRERMLPVDETLAPKPGDVWHLAIFERQRDEANAWLTKRGWRPAADADPADGAPEGASPSGPSPS